MEVSPFLAKMTRPEADFCPIREGLGIRSLHVLQRLAELSPDAPKYEFLVHINGVGANARTPPSLRVKFAPLLNIHSLLNYDPSISEIQLIDGGLPLYHGEMESSLSMVIDPVS